MEGWGYGNPFADGQGKPTRAVLSAVKNLRMVWSLSAREIVGRAMHDRLFVHVYIHRVVPLDTSGAPWTVVDLTGCCGECADEILNVAELSIGCREDESGRGRMDLAGIAGRGSGWTIAPVWRGPLGPGWQGCVGVAGIVVVDSTARASWRKVVGGEPATGDRRGREDR